MLECIIFDLDGVIVDSEPVHFLAYKKTFEKLGINFSKEDYLCFGVARGDDFFVKNILQKYGEEKDPEDICRQKKECFEKMIETDLRLRDGFADLLSFCEGKYKLAVASSAKQEAVNLILERFKIAKYFQSVLCGDQVENVKPAPDIYLKTMQLLGVSPEQCVAVEDSKTGLLAAKEAQIRCVVASTEFTSGNNFSGADFVVKDLEEIQAILPLL